MAHPDKSIGEESGNLIIHGDNLHALKALLPRYAVKVDCIFIDPPYNTGNENWNYNDNVNSPIMREVFPVRRTGVSDCYGTARHDPDVSKKTKPHDVLMNTRKNKLILATTGVALSFAMSADVSSATAVTLEELAKKLDGLMAENAQLRQRVQQLESRASGPAVPTQDAQVAATPSAKPAGTSRPAAPADNNSGFVGFNHTYAYDVLDPTVNINRKQQLILENRRSGNLAKNSVYLSGAATAIANYQRSNTEDKFGYLMQFPLDYKGKNSSEALIHSAQLAATATLGDWVTAYAELLYDPKRRGTDDTTTINDLNRNQVHLRRGYVMLGNLDKYPAYLSVGKMAVPFGLTDTVNPFTASTLWHAFGGLAYGARAGYSRDGLNVDLMGIQGGAQFRAVNTSASSANEHGKLDNFAVNASYDFGATDDIRALLGASYIRGTSYCQGFPVTQHLGPCTDENGAYDVYAQARGDKWQVQAEFAQTEDEWPGTFNPDIPQFAASKVTSWGVGGKYSVNLMDTDMDLSLEFSRFDAGPSGADWEKQDQYVLGVSGYITPSVKVFGEYIHTDGWVPLVFVSGQAGQNTSWSDADAKSDVALVGINAAF